MEESPPQQMLPSRFPQLLERNNGLMDKEHRNKATTRVVATAANKFGFPNEPIWDDWSRVHLKSVIRKKNLSAALLSFFTSP